MERRLNAGADGRAWLVMDLSPAESGTMGLKELILHCVHLQNMDALARIPQLKKLTLSQCTFGGKDLSVRCGAPNLKELGLRGMSLAGLMELKDLKSLAHRVLVKRAGKE